ncbi:solute carrier family 22 member 7-like [Cebidichthys violaceus]|uniref:solute carrier family 22 member 7-like n=1 Tax=Cebidichthys violaceus TaxID=271503 RepID=UPI0035CAF1B6
MSPLQLSVYWRLSLVFIFSSFLFFLDVFTAAVVGASCRHGNVTEDGAGTSSAPQSAGLNQSRPGEASESGNRDSVCEWTDWLAYSQTLFMVGLLLGSLVGGAISDRYGKRTVLLVSVYVHAVCGLVPAVLPQPFLYLAVRCVTGVCCCCINICSFSLGNINNHHLLLLLLYRCYQTGLTGSWLTGLPVSFIGPQRDTKAIKNMCPG